MQCSAKQPYESVCFCVTSIKSSWPLLYLYSPYSCTVISQRLTPTKFSTYTEAHTMWFLKCSSVKHLSSAFTCSLYLYPCSVWEAWQGDRRIRSLPDHLVKKHRWWQMNMEQKSRPLAPLHLICPASAHHSRIN